MSNVEKRLQKLGKVLPQAPTPAANYIPWTVAGDTVYIAGQVPMVDGKVARTGHVGDDVSVEEAQQLAAVCAVNGIAQLKNALASVDKTLDEVRVVKVGVFVAAAAGFWDSHKVANGASDLLAAAFGDKGKHARSAVGVHELPLGVPVEVELICSLV